jgi:hypothetical protein
MMAPIQTSRRRFMMNSFRFRWIAAIGALLVAAFLLLRWATERSPDPAGFPHLKAGKTETRSRVSSGESSLASAYATFSSDRVVLFSDNPHPLCRKIVARLEQRLKDCPHIRTVVRVDQPFTITSRDAAPDLFVRVDLAMARRNGILASTFQSVVTASLGSTPWFDTTRTSDEAGSPAVSLEWRATVDSESTFTGISSDRYAAAASDIAETLATSMIKFIEKMNDKYPRLPALPAEFFGPYEPVADFDWMSAFSARRMASYCGLFTHNETFWRLELPADPVPALKQVAQSLKSAGWEVVPLELTTTLDPRMEARLGDGRIKLSKNHKRDHPLDAPATNKERVEFIVHHRKPLSRIERTRALELLLSQDASDPAERMPFMYSFTPDQRTRFFASLEKSGSRLPQGCLELARGFLELGRTNEAAHQLLRTHALSATRPDSDSLQQEIRKLAERISPKTPLNLGYTPEICRELGFIEIPQVARPMEFTRRLGEPLVLFGPFNDRIRITALTVRALGKGDYSVEDRRAERDMSGTGSSGFTNQKNAFLERTVSGGGRDVTIRHEILPDSSGVKFTVRPETDPHQAL